MTDAELLRHLEKLQSTMISVATGGPKIDSVNGDFQAAYAEVADALAERGLQNPIPFQSLWDWYGRWRTGDLPTYQSRRDYVNGIFRPLVTSIGSAEARSIEPTGWTRVDRALSRCQQQLANAVGEEDFQSVGLHCREILISLSEVVWDPDRHPTLDGVQASATDAKRKLEAYIAVELASGANEQIRKHARASLDLAVALQHRRTAGYRDAAMCLEGTISIVNLLAIVQGRRDPDLAGITVESPAPDVTLAPMIARGMAEAAQDFSTDRINKVQMGGHLPTVLAPGPRLFLHLIPVYALQEGAAIDHMAMRRLQFRFKPAHYDKFLERTNIEGWLLWQPPQPSPPLPSPVSSWCSLVTNEGITEIIETLVFAGQYDPPPAIKGYPLERDIVATLDQLADGYAELGITSPAILRVTLLGVQGVRLERSRPGHALGFDRPFIMLPELHLERIAKPVGNFLRPLFDTLWRAAGWSDGSQSFQRGEWAGYGEGRIY
jgi:hypothetical protein